MQKLLSIILSSIICLGINAQKLSFFEVFTDHAVLQREVSHPIWGWAKPRSKVTLKFDNQVYQAKADADGRWQVILPAQKAGGPYDLTVANKKESISIEGLYFGDVYLLSGQSNMEWKLRQSDPDGSRAREVADPMIREITVNKSTADQPAAHLELSAAWRAGTQDQIGNFSAVGSYFAHYLREEMEDLPIGLLHSSWGGSRIEPWMPAHLLGLDNAAPKEEEARDAAALTTYKNEFNNSTPPTEDQGEKLGYLKSDFNYGAWPTVAVPGLWESKGYANVNGHFYYARYFDLSEEQAATDATLSLGAIDDSDWTYVNGQQVGATYGAYAAERSYQIPASVLQPGKNVILVRVEDTGGGGGFHSSPEKMQLETRSGNVSLAGNWHYQIGSWSVDRQLNQVPTILYNKMIHPLAGLPLKGILWYQGESNAAPTDAAAYADQFKAMITYWRKHFNNPDLPFYWVQLANFQAAQESPDETGWGAIRNSQTAALELPNTGQAVIIDIGEADDIHPRNKWEVGRRLSLLARQNIYGEKKLNARSPIATDARGIGASGIRVTVDQDGRELVAKGNRYGYAKGFVVRDRKGKWHWARADLMLGGKSILVYPPKGITPTAVRYGYADNPTDANVYNEAGLPLTPFSIELQ